MMLYIIILKKTRAFSCFLPVQRAICHWSSLRMMYAFLLFLILLSSPTGGDQFATQTPFLLISSPRTIRCGRSDGDPCQRVVRKAKRATTT